MELIIYLEPPVDFKQDVQSFLDLCQNKFGPTTANKYNCHVSMSGFFTVTKQQHQDVVLDSIRKSLPKAKENPSVKTTPLLVQDQNNSPCHLLLPVIAPMSLHAMMTQVANICQTVAHVRLKKINHISLAYWDEPEEIEVRKTDILKEIEREAKEYFEKIKPPMGTWDIVLYERARRSLTLTEPHLFRELARWPCNAQQ